LQESAVLADYLGGGVASEKREGLAAVDYGRVGRVQVAEEEGASVVDEAEVDFRVGSQADTDLGGLIAKPDMLEG